ncbi:uncharacterized protein LOC135138535 [Zophobas morio]|uniref:uncharacterized protein LOC135138535 n=1 Tax=Zophobas morio TaxID=2755281 RepID=UPI003082F013
MTIDEGGNPEVRPSVPFAGGISLRHNHAMYLLFFCEYAPDTSTAQLCLLGSYKSLNLYEVFDKHVPLFKCKKRSFPSWYSKELRDLMKLKEKFHQRWKRNPTPEFYYLFANARQRIKRTISREFQDYITRAERSLKKDPKSFWSFINQKKGQSTLPNCVQFGDNTYSDPHDIVDVFALHLIYVLMLRYVRMQSVRLFHNLKIIVSLVKIRFPVFLLEIASIRIWKVAKVVPVFKSGDHSHEHISIYQHGFTSGRSTLTNLVCMSQYIADVLDNMGQLDVIYLDMSKALDKLKHRTLLEKLSNFGFSQRLLEFFASYLSSRRNFVHDNGFKSSCYIATSGVPQGSILGPLLFLIYINDLVDVIENSKSDMNKLQFWSKLNGIPLNRDKCVAMTFMLCAKKFVYDYNIDGTAVQRFTTVKDLGQSNSVEV